MPVWAPVALVAILLGRGVLGQLLYPLRHSLGEVPLPSTVGSRV